MLPLVKRDAFWERREDGSLSGETAETAEVIYEDVAMTLGSGIDALQEDYHQKGMLSESYMLEVLAGELLMQAYRAYNRYVKEHAKRHVARYHFPGSEEEFPLAKLPQNQEIQCESICTGCGNIHCPNRMEDVVLFMNPSIRHD